MGAVADPDAVGVVEPRLLARVLDPVDDLARAPFGDEPRRQRGVEDDEQLAVAGGGEALLLDQADLDVLRR